jgi:mono/diheme cytochrome c family protein
MMRIPQIAVLVASLALAPVFYLTGAHAQGTTAQGTTAQGTTAQGTTAPTARGEYVARAGDCVACHSAPGGQAFAGGLKMGTPLGAIWTTNITPDIETGIGTYTLQDFDRAVRRGVARDGHRLYPAMPYPSYAKISDADVQALYDYFMRAVRPVHQANKPSDIPTLLRLRWPLAIWDMLFTARTGFTANPQKDAVWNRGAYLVEGLGHCGACHTPRGWAMQETALGSQSSDFLSGANLDYWYAPSLRQDVLTGLGTWSQSDIVQFLKTGHNQHGSAFGSMRDVINNSSPYLNDDDLNSIAVFLKSLPARSQEAAYTYDGATATALLNGKADAVGATLYVSNCQSCHRETGAAAPPFVPPLAGNPTVVDKDAASLVNIVLNGSAPLVVEGRPDAYRMPQFREQLNNQQIANIVTFIRNGWGNHAAAVSASEVGELRERTDPTSDRVVILKMR